MDSADWSEWRERLWTEQKDDWVHRLWTAYLHIASNGTADAQKWSDDDRVDFREAAESGHLFAIVETLKVLAEREANAAGLSLPAGALIEWSAQHVRYGQPLASSDRDRLGKVSTELYALVMRLNARQQVRGPGRPSTPKAHKAMMKELRRANRTYKEIAEAVNEEFKTGHNEDSVRKQLKRLT